MIRFFIGIVMVLITFYIAIIYGSVAIGLLGFAEAVLLVAAFVFLLYFRRKLEASIGIPIAVAEQGDKVTVRISVTNRSRILCAKIRYQFRCGSTFSNRFRTAWENGAPVLHGKNAYSAQIELPYAGKYVIELVRMRVYDMSGIFYMDKKIGKSAGIQVLPEVAEVSVRISERTRNFYGDADVYDDFRPGHDRSEIFDVREFRAGDKVQSIHWKLSAKSDELVVREDAQPLACPVVLILTQEFPRSLQAVEVYLSVAASLVFSLMDAGCPHYVAWYSGSRQDIVRVRVDDEEGYYLFLSHYLEDGQGRAQMTTVELYKEKYRYDHQLYTLVLGADFVLWQNGDRLTTVDSKDWKGSVHKLELIL